MYLLRFDDICPTMNWKIWAEIESALVEHQLKPILAVVPDNQDPTLMVQPAVENFWERVRQWQARGWTIALHGHQHKYIGERPGIITPRKMTEFAGVPEAEQAEKLRLGTGIFRREKIHARVWIAPSNSFDATTVSLLPKFGIRIISDGNFRFPFCWPADVLWVPQQLFGFRPVPDGIWTVCYHHNRWTTTDLDQFREDLSRYASEIGSLNEAICEYPARPSRWAAFLCRNYGLSAFLVRSQLKLTEWQDRQRQIVRWTDPRRAAEPQ